MVEGVQHGPVLVGTFFYTGQTNGPWVSMKMTSIVPWTVSPLMTRHRLSQSHVHMTP